METVEFDSEGYRLIGNLHLPLNTNAPCTVLCHGLVSSKDSEKWLTFASRLEDEGVASLTFNFRGCGWGKEYSEGEFQDTTLTDRIKDYKAALDFLESTGRYTMNLGPKIDNDAGKVSFGAASYGSNPGPEGTGTLALITFITGQDESASDLELQEVCVLDTGADSTCQTCTVEDGSVEFAMAPTAVTLSSFAAESTAGGSASWLWLGLVGLTVLAAGSLFWAKRRAG